MAQTAFTLLTPANGSGVLGLARETLDGTTLTVDVVASGLTPGQPHPLHLNGFVDGTAALPATGTADANGDGRVDASEAATATGPVLLDLAPDGGLVPDAAGNAAFIRSFALNPADPGQAAILQHFGSQVLDLNGLALGPGTTGYDATVPVAQGTTVAVSDPTAANALAGVSDQSFLAHAIPALAALAPYELNPAGTAHVAPEPAGAATPGTDTYAALLLPSNNSGALGATVVSLDRADGILTVDLAMTGLTPGEAHASHIHGFANDVPSLVPNYRLDADGDGFVEDSEGEAVVGPVILGLTKDGSITDASITGNWPVADAHGNLSLHETYTFNAADPAQFALLSELEARLAGREVQVHGLAVPATEGDGTAYEVNGTAGYKPQLPVANGILLPITDAAAGQGITALVADISHAGAVGDTSAEATAATVQALAGLAANGHWFA